MKRVFGVKKEKELPPPPPIGDASDRISDRGETVDGKIKKLDVQLHRYKEQIKKTRPGPAQEAVKARAMRVLKQKRVYEGQRDMLYNQTCNLDQVGFASEGIRDAHQTITALKSANVELKGMTRIVKIQDIDYLHDEMVDLMDVNNAIQETLGRSCSVPDDIDEHMGAINMLQAFVSEYAVAGKDAGAGSLLAALAEAGFLIGLEKNSDVVEMASYAPLFVNANNKWNPDEIVFNSSQLYGTPSYWVQCFLSESSGATIFNATLQTNSSTSILASAISWKSSEDQKTYLRIKIVNFGSNIVNLRIHVDGLEPDSISLSGSTKTAHIYKCDG